MELYSTKEASEKIGIPRRMLRFYCDKGLVPGVRRNKLGYRVFTEKNIEWVRNLSCLKNCGMGVSEMKRYVDLCQQGTKTIPERQEILKTKLQNLRHEIERIEKNMDFIMYKRQFYQDVLEGKREYISNLTEDELEI